MQDARQTLSRLLAEKRFGALPALLDQEPGVLRKLYSLLIHREPLTRWRAVTGLGVLAAERPAPVRRILSRLVWSLNDEASTCVLVGPAALAEIHHHNPALARDVVRIAVHYFEDEETCHSANRNVTVLCAALWAVGRVGETDPQLAREVIPTLARFLGDAEAEVRGHARWAVARAGLTGAPGLPAAADGDKQAVATVYDPDSAELLTRPVAVWGQGA